jgi:putative endonuclease
MAKQPAVYIPASKRNGTFYIGVTEISNSALGNTKTIWWGFTKKYGVYRLVYYELHEDMMSAIRREKQLKK